MLMRMLLVGLMATQLNACEIIGHATEQDAGCAWAKPIYLSKQDSLTKATADQLVAHNETGEKRCGWKRIKK